MKKLITAAVAAALILIGTPLAASADGTETTEETVEVVATEEVVVVEDVVEEIVLDEPVVEAAPEVEVAPPAPVETTPEVVGPAPFVPYSVSKRWIIPASWPFKTTPSYQAAIFPQTPGTTIPCNQWSQDDVYWLESPDEVTLYESLDDDGVLTQGEDAAIYQSHTFVKGEACGPVTVTIPTYAPTPPTCDTDGGPGIDTSRPAQNPNGYEQSNGTRIYVSPALNGPGTYVYTTQKIGAGFDPAFPYGTKVVGQTTQTITILGATGYQDVDATLPCYVAPEVPVEPETPVTPEAPVVVPVAEQPVVAALAPTADVVVVDEQPAVATLAATGSNNSAVVPLVGGAAAILAIGAILLYARHRAGLKR